jgi:hypothetical protein
VQLSAQLRKYACCQKLLLLLLWCGDASGAGPCCLQGLHACLPRHARVLLLLQLLQCQLNCSQDVRQLLLLLQLWLLLLLLLLLRLLLRLLQCQLECRHDIRMLLLLLRGKA